MIASREQVLVLSSMQLHRARHAQVFGYSGISSPLILKVRRVRYAQVNVVGNIRHELS